MNAMTSQITSLTIVYSTVYSGADQRKYQSSASLAFMIRIHRLQISVIYSLHNMLSERILFTIANRIQGHWTSIIIIEMRRISVRLTIQKIDAIHIFNFFYESLPLFWAFEARFYVCKLRLVPKFSWNQSGISRCTNGDHVYTGRFNHDIYYEHIKHHCSDVIWEPSRVKSPAIPLFSNV